jgi:hypothetical protein
LEIFHCLRDFFARIHDERAVTGDWFAVIAPMGIILGRIGCCTRLRSEPCWRVRKNGSKGKYLTIMATETSNFDLV